MPRISNSTAKKTLIAFFLYLSAMVIPGIVVATESDIANGGGQPVLGERPNAGGAAESVLLEFALLDIDDIDDKEQRFSIDAYFEIKWQDLRLAAEPDKAQAGQIRVFSVDEIWTPGLTIVNDRGLSVKLPEVVFVDRDGNATLRQRISGSLASNLKLQKFPFDTQHLPIDIVSYRHTPSELTYSTDTTFIGDTSKFSAGGWDFELKQPEFSVFKLTQEKAGASQLTLTVSATRHFGFFILTLALPMTLILFMAWTVHWLQPDIAPSRLGMSTATVFSLIALGVSFRLSLPQIDYLTQADRFVMYSTILVLISLGITVLATRWVNEDRLNDAVRLTLLTRWAFPLVFALIIVLTLRA